VHGVVGRVDALESVPDGLEDFLLGVDLVRISVRVHHDLRARRRRSTWRTMQVDSGQGDQSLREVDCA